MREGTVRSLRRSPYGAGARYAARDRGDTVVPTVLLAGEAEDYTAELEDVRAGAVRKNDDIGSGTARKLRERRPNQCRTTLGEADHR